MDKKYIKIKQRNGKIRYRENFNTNKGDNLYLINCIRAFLGKDPIPTNGNEIKVEKEMF